MRDATAYASSTRTKVPGRRVAGLADGDGRGRYHRLLTSNGTCYFRERKPLAPGTLCPFNSPEHHFPQSHFPVVICLTFTFRFTDILQPCCTALDVVDRLCSGFTTATVLPRHPYRDCQRIFEQKHCCTSTGKGCPSAVIKVGCSLPDNLC